MPYPKDPKMYSPEIEEIVVESKEDFYIRTMPKKEEVIEQVYSPQDKQMIPKKGENISIFGKIKINEWNGRKTPQLHIIDIANSQIN